MGHVQLREQSDSDGDPCGLGRAAIKALDQGLQLLFARDINGCGELNAHSISGHAGNRFARDGRPFVSGAKAKQDRRAGRRWRHSGDKAAAKADIGHGCVHDVSLAAEPDFDRQLAFAAYMPAAFCCAHKGGKRQRTMVHGGEEKSKVVTSE